MKKSLLISALSFLLGIGITVGASTIYNALDIVYTPSDSTWNATNVSEALNDLNNYKNLPNMNKINGSISSNNVRNGVRAADDYITLSLTKGNYYLVVNESNLTHSSSTRSSINALLEGGVTTIDGTCTFIQGSKVVQDSNTLLDDNETKAGLYVFNSIYKCVLLSDQTITYTNLGDTAGSGHARDLNIYAIKID